MTRTCSLAECGSPKAGCQSQLTSYQSLDSCLTWTSTPFSVQCIHLRNLCPQLNLLTHPMHARTHSAAATTPTVVLCLPRHPAVAPAHHQTGVGRRRRRSTTLPRNVPWHPPPPACRRRSARPPSPTTAHARYALSFLPPS